MKKDWCPDRRDMIWIDCNPQTSREMADFHPLMVLSTREFNQRTGIVIGLPMTTASYNESNPFAVKMDRAGKPANYILTHQPKSYDWRGRGAKPHPLKVVPEAIYQRACNSLNKIISN